MKLKSTSARVLSSRGFTLVELMVTILVVSILAAIAIPTYSAQIRKSRRTEARTALLDAAAREEQFYATHNLYTETPADLGYPAFPAPVGGSYYTLDVKCSDKTCANGFTATASPTGTQLKDTTCTAFTVTQTGLQGATPGANAATACWN
jgi:type IV pilus assembly protein PilE